MQRNVLDVLWSVFSSRRLGLTLLAVIALVALSGAALPQIPAGVAADSSQYDRWYTEIRARYLQWAEPLERLGFFNIRGSLWFKLPMGLLILNLAVCAVRQFEALRRRHEYTAKTFDDAFRQACQRRTFVVSGTVESAVATLRTLLQGHRYEVEVRVGKGGTYLDAQRLSLAKWAPLAAHAGMGIAIIGVLLGTALAWREEGIHLSPGQMYHIQHAPSLSVRLDGLEVELYQDGAPRHYHGQLTILEGEEEVAKGVVEPNAPFTYRGIAFHQRSHGPAIQITGLDQQGEAVSLQPLVPGGTLQEAAIIQLSEKENEGYVGIPDQNLVLRLVFHSHLPSDGGATPALLVEAYRGGVTDLVFSETFLESTSILIEDGSYTLEWGHYGVLTISSDPTSPPILLGAGCLLVAAIVTLHLPPRHIGAVVSGKGGVVGMRLARLGEADKGASAREFELLMDEVEEHL